MAADLMMPFLAITKPLLKKVLYELIQRDKAFRTKKYSHIHGSILNIQL
jgi:hypothetical protein